jgi:fatty-acyl-CoA synthase
MMNAPYSRTLFDLLTEQAERHRDHIAVISGDLQVTYGDLLTRASKIAGGLRGIGLKRGDRVGLLINNRIEWLELFFGAAAIGVTVVPFSTWSKPRELDFLIEDGAINALFTLDKLGEDGFGEYVASVVPEMRDAAPGTWASARWPNLRSVVIVGSGNSTGSKGALTYANFADGSTPLTATPPPGEGARPHDAAVILYTSGSTSYPKAVPLAHGPMIENGFNIGERQGLQAGERVMLSLPLFWSYGCANAACATFTHGCTLVLQPRFEPGEALDLIERHGVNSIYTLPGMTAALITHPKFDKKRTASLRTGLTIGSPQDVVAAAEELGIREICNVYGQTESYGNCCVAWHHWPLERRKTTQGPPLPGVTVRIADEETGKVVTDGGQGLIEVKGNLTPGYAGRSTVQNETAFTPDGFFKTGDLGRLTPEGDIQYIGRSGEMIKRAGINIAPAEVEELLQQHPDIALAGVTGVPDPIKGEFIMAFVIRRPGSTVDEEQLRSFCRSNASSYKTPDRVELCDALPLTPTGKILRRELKQMALAKAGL